MRAAVFIDALKGLFQPSAKVARARAYLAGQTHESEAELRALGALSGAERRGLERRALRMAPTPRTLAALGVLGGARARRRLALHFARECGRLAKAPDASGALLIAAAAALWKLAPEDRLVLAVAARLRGAPARAERMRAADALAGMIAPAGAEALGAALEDSDPLVRHIAARALLTAYGLEVEARAARVLEERLRAAAGG